MDEGSDRGRSRWMDGTLLIYNRHKAAINSGRQRECVCVCVRERERERERETERER